MGEKLVECQLWVEVTHVTTWGDMRFLPPESNETIFVRVSYFLLLVFFALKVVRGDDFLPHVPMDLTYFQ